MYRLVALNDYEISFVKLQMIAHNFGNDFNLVNDYNGSLFATDVSAEKRGIDIGCIYQVTDAMNPDDITNNGNPVPKQLNAASSLDFLKMNFNHLIKNVLNMSE